MVTGDNIQTAKAIALECGILASDADASEQIIEGKTFRELSEQERENAAQRISVGNIIHFSLLYIMITYAPLQIYQLSSNAKLTQDVLHLQCTGGASLLKFGAYLSITYYNSMPGENFLNGCMLIYRLWEDLLRPTSFYLFKPYANLGK